MPRRIVIGILGFLTVILGTSLIFREWDLIMNVCLAVIGPLLAVAGLVMMFYASTKND